MMGVCVLTAAHNVRLLRGEHGFDARGGLGLRACIGQQDGPAMQRARRKPARQQPLPDEQVPHGIAQIGQGERVLQFCLL